MLGINQKAKKTAAKTPIEKPAGSDIDSRRREVRMQRKENREEKKRIANLKREQAVRDRETERKIKEARGATHGMMFFDEKPVKKKKKIVGRRKTSRMHRSARRH